MRDSVVEDFRHHRHRIALSCAGLHLPSILTQQKEVQRGTQGHLHSLTMEGSHLFRASEFEVRDCQSLSELQVGLPGDKGVVKNHKNEGMDNTLR